MIKIDTTFKLSWSALTFYDQCPYKFAKIYLEGYKEPSNIFALFCNLNW